MLQLKEEFQLDCQQQEMVVSSMLFGALLGSLTGGREIFLFFLTFLGTYSPLSLPPGVVLGGGEGWGRDFVSTVSGCEQNFPKW